MLAKLNIFWVAMFCAVFWASILAENTEASHAWTHVIKQESQPEFKRLRSMYGVNFIKIMQQLERQVKASQDLTAQVEALQKQNGTLKTRLQTEQQTSQKLHHENNGQTNQLAALQGQNTALESQLAGVKQQLAQTHNRTIPDNYTGDTDVLNQLLKAVYRDVHNDEPGDMDLQQLLRGFIEGR